MNLCKCGCGGEVGTRRTQIAGKPHLRPGVPRDFLPGHRKHPKTMWLPEDRGYETPCHIWQRGKASNGYGIRTLDGRQMGAHRAAWIETNGPIPPGGYVCHKCDVKECVNVDHLYVGTHRDNMRDAAERDRMEHRRGELAPNSKLTWADVDAIRASTDTQTALAKRYGVSQGAIWKILNGRAWQ